MRNRIKVEELTTYDQDVYITLKDDDTYASTFRDSIVISFEVEYGYTSTTVYNVVIERNKLQPGFDEAQVREEMRTFGLERLKVVLSGQQIKKTDQEKEKENISPEGYLFTHKIWKTKLDPVIEEEYRRALKRVLDTTPYQLLIRVARELFPSPDSSLITETIKSSRRILDRIDRNYGIPERPTTYISRTDKDEYLSLLDKLYNELSNSPSDLQARELAENIRGILLKIDEIHLRYDFRRNDIEPLDPALLEIEQSVSLLDDLYKKRPQFNEVLAFLKSFSESRDQAREAIIEDSAKIFNRRSSGINTKWWLWGGYALAFWTFLYMLAVFSHFHIAWLSGSEWFSKDIFGESPYSDVIVRIAIFSILSYVTIFCFRQYVYERKAKEIYEFKQTALNAMSNLLAIHKGDQDQTNQIMMHSLPHIFNDTSASSEKHQTTDTNQAFLIEIMKLLRQQK